MATPLEGNKNTDFLFFLFFFVAVSWGGEEKQEGSEMEDGNDRRDISKMLKSGDDD